MRVRDKENQTDMLCKGEEHEQNLTAHSNFSSMQITLRHKRRMQADSGKTKFYPQDHFLYTIPITCLWVDSHLRILGVCLKMYTATILLKSNIPILKLVYHTHTEPEFKCCFQEFENQNLVLFSSVHVGMSLDLLLCRKLCWKQTWTINACFC